MVEYAPDAIKAMFNTIRAAIPEAVMGGIVGDAAHTYGYHRGRNYVGGNDYSAQLPPDREGDGEAASALDLSWTSASWQYEASRRLLAGKNDARLSCLREFYGSTDGRTVCGWDYYHGYAVTSDDSHLWHIHISVLRKYANDHAALQAAASVITGGAAPPSGGDDELSDADVKKINDNTNHGNAMVLYGDGRDVPPERNTHPDNIKQVRKQVGDAQGAINLAIYGDGRDVPAGSDTHPYNLKLIYQMCKDIQDRLAALEQGR